MITEVYTVHAYRYGDRELHSYTVGVYSTKEKALETATEENSWRGGKYECEVLEVYIDNASADYKTILALPK